MTGTSPTSEENERTAQITLSTAPKYKFKMIQSIAVTLTIDVPTTVIAHDIKDATKLVTKIHRTEFINFARERLKELMAPSYSDNEDYLRDLFFSKAIAKGIINRKEEDILCIEQSDPLV